MSREEITGRGERGKRGRERASNGRQVERRGNGKVKRERNRTDMKRGQEMKVRG